MSWLVLWVYLSTPWSLGPVMMAPGWFSAAVFQDSASCLEAVQNLKALEVLMPRHTLAVCLPPDADPKEEESSWSGL